MSKQIKYPLAQAKTSWQLVVLGMLVGFLASLAIISLRLSIDFVQSFYMPVVDDYSQQSQYGRLIAPFIGALIIVFIAFITKSRYHRMGIPFVLYRQRKFYGYIPIGNSINQFFSAMAAIASGFSVGREGPAVHIGAGTASYLSQKLQLPDNAGRILTACGMAAGISASFNSPLAAVVFVLEVVLLQFRIHLFLPIMVSSLIGAAMSRLVFGNIQQFTDLSFPQITIESSLPFFALGIIV
ncbi:MAG: chloride channel protein, partial [Psychrobium sp.]|nr:chloride channel protein [Psychrobium sp.]